MDLIYLLPLLPATGAAINGLIGMRSFGRRSVGTIAGATILFALMLSISILSKLIALPADARVHNVVLGDWIPAIPSETSTGIQMFVVTWTLRLDLLSAILAVVVAGVGVLVHWYAATSLRDASSEKRARVFTCLGLGVGFMLMFVLAGNFLVLLVGWEGMALCVSLLSGVWHDRETPATSGMTAILVNQIGACALLVGILVVYFSFGTIDFREVAAAGLMPLETHGFGALSGILHCGGIEPAPDSLRTPRRQGLREWPGRRDGDRCVDRLHVREAPHRSHRGFRRADRRTDRLPGERGSNRSSPGLKPHSSCCR